MLGHSALSQPSVIFDTDQQSSVHVTTWNTPFTPLESGVASAGLVFDAREPVPGADWLGYRTAFAAATPANAATAFTDTRSTGLVSGGRAPSIFDSWGAGAPAWFGNSQRGQIALHWSGVLRPVVGRSWFSSSATVTMSLAVAGQGYLRVIRTPSGGAATEVNVGGSAGLLLTETDYLTNGMTFTDVFTVGVGDRLDVYYIQNRETWGGVVVKAVLGSAQTAALAQSAPLFGCDLFDDGSTVAANALGSAQSVEVTHDINAASSALIALPLLNPAQHDGFGYEWVQTANADDPGILRYWTDGVIQFTIRRGQLLQVAGGYVNEEYTTFTGFIDDFDPPKDGIIHLRCVGFERRAIKDQVRNEPDELSYMAFGYRTLTGATEPVYGIRAYDNWAIEYAVADVLLRAGINSSRLMAPLLATKADGSTAAVVYNTVANPSDAFSKFRARSVLGKQLRCERSVNYGNVGFAFQDYLPADDAYVFPPEDSKDSWSRVREISDRYGYDMRFDNVGDAVLKSRGNASTVVDVDNTISTGPAGTRKTSPSAFRGTYYEWANGALATVQFTFTGSRVDISLPLGVNLGSWSSMKVVRVSDSVVMANTTNVSASNTSDVFYYDYRTTPTGQNATLLTLFSGAYDTYQVQLVANSGTADTLTRRLDCFFVYAVDPLMPVLPNTLSTAINALDVTAASNADDQRNLVYVVGRRKAAVTDSAKLLTNPNNAEPEFIVSVAVDVDSISNPNARNYTGARHTAAIFDSSITDPDYADYAARTFIYRYRSPRPPADIRHTGLPFLEVREPVFVREAQFQTITELYVLWVTHFTHRWEASGAFTTTIATSSWPEFPSYDLREDIDIDADFGGAPITNVAVSYTSLTGQVQTNLASHGIVQETTDADIVSINVPVTAGTPQYLDLTGSDWPPVPGTLFLQPNTLAGPAGAVTFNIGPTTGTQPLSNLVFLNTNNTLGPIPLPAARTITSVVATIWTKNGATTGAPSQTFTLGTDNTNNNTLPWYEWDDVKRQMFIRTPRVLYQYAGYHTFVITYAQTVGGLHGDTLTDNPYHHFTNVDYRDANRKIFLPWKQGDGSAPYQLPSAYTSFTAKYRRLWASTAGAFADPYAGNSPFADPTTTELGYLCSLTFDALVTGYYRISVRSVHDDTVVAYLTEPTSDVTNPERHWSYVTAGRNRSWNWDYVDQIGVWNLRQSADYSAAIQGQFELTEKEPIGAGWYVWNRDTDHGKLGPLALISGDRDASTGKPVFGHATYAAWYFCIETKNDALLAAHNADLTGAKAYPRVAKTIEPQQGEIALTYTTAGKAALVYTHLPEPSQCELSIQDWVSGTAYDASNPAHATTDSNWGAPDADASLHNQKPVRVQFRVKPRPGALWSGKTAEQQIKLTRHVHLRALIFDQFEVDSGGSYPDSTVPQRTVTSRRMSDDDHTIVYQDSDFRKAKTFRNPTYPTGTLQWVFKPNDFRKKFRDIDNEPLDFANYLQLTEVPKFDLNRQVASTNSRYIIGFMAYLFYLSAYVQDRSGRRCWGVNRQFLDTAKNAANAAGDWWAPTTPGTAATANAVGVGFDPATTYRADWPVDPTRLQRRSVFARQWTNEPNWQANQRARWFGGTVGSIGDLLLRFKWNDMEPGATTLAGSAWPVLDTDDHSNWHADASRTELPAAFQNMTRQLGTSTTTRLGSWTWEANPVWVPCIQRDFHAYYLVPPMPDYRTSPRTSYVYTSVDSRGYDNSTNEGDDVAAGAVWSSWTRDMTQAYNATSSGLKRFQAGTRVDTTIDPNRPTLATNAHDYSRQDMLVHYEDLRGMYSRGPRPSEQPMKVTPGMPYYMNCFTYSQLGVGPSLPSNSNNSSHHSDLPKWVVNITKWFRLSFRSEYVVESERYFPTDVLGREYLGAFNLEGARMLSPTQQAAVHFDAGAWVGWKDDLSGTLLGDPSGKDNSGTALGNVFDSPYMPVQLGPVLPQTVDMYMHLTLVNERRASPL